MKPIRTGLFLLFLMIFSAGCSAKPSETSAPETTPVPEPAETALPQETTPEPEKEPETPAKLLYIGHASLRITTPEDKVIYVDPYAPGDYSRAADMILVTHDHYDHTAQNLIAERAEDCTVITQNEALVSGEHQTFENDCATVKAVQAGNNPNHDISRCVGYVITLTNGISIYVSGDTSTTDEMAELKNDNIDYALFCCDGVYNMDAAEASQCAALVNAKHSIPYHVIPPEGVYFSREKAEAFTAENRLILEPGEEIELGH